MRKIYIDLGAYKGKTIKAFKSTAEYSPDVEMYAFAPNPHDKVHRKPRGAKVYQKAVWIEDCVKPFYTNTKHKACQGASLLKDKVSGGLNKKKPLMVECIDFGKWIKKMFNKTDHIIVKMDIEGAEFKVLRQMIKDGSILYVNKLYIEAHGNDIGLGPNSNQELLDDLSKVKSLAVGKEFAHLTYKKGKGAIYYDKMYSTRDKYKTHYTKTKYYPLWEKLLKDLQKNKVKKVLDIGCGAAQLGRMLTDNSIDYMGFDYSKIGIEIAKGLHVWVGDVHDEENYHKADAYLCMEVLEHLKDDRKIFSYLPKGCLFYFSVPTFKHEQHLRRFKREEKIIKRYSDLCSELKIEKVGKRFLCRGVL